MAASVTLVLDTTPPVPTWGAPDRLPDGRVVIEYGLDEPELVAASINNHSVAITPTQIETYERLSQGGEMELRALVRDDVGNEQILNQVIWLAPSSGKVSKTHPGAQVEGPEAGAFGGMKTGIQEEPEEGVAD